MELDRKSQLNLKLHVNGISLLCKLCDSLYTDARELECGHSFCLQCLLKTQSKECQTCQRETIPETSAGRYALKQQGVLSRAIKDYIRSVEYGYTYSKQLKDFFSSFVSISGEDSHHIDCKVCEQEIVGSRYVCGVCEEYDLCESCYISTRIYPLSDHDKLHLFIKLRRPQKKEVPRTRLLCEKANQMMETADSTTLVHRISTPTIKGPIACDICYGKTKVFDPIIGAMYRCGTCNDYDLCGRCESHEQDPSHDRNHVFIVIPYVCDYLLPPNAGNIVTQEFY